jgi:hypothetical protein
MPTLLHLGKFLQYQSIALSDKDLLDYAQLVHKPSIEPLLHQGKFSDEYMSTLVCSQYQRNCVHFLEDQRPTLFQKKISIQIHLCLNHILDFGKILTQSLCLSNSNQGIS